MATNPSDNVTNDVETEDDVLWISAQTHQEILGLRYAINEILKQNVTRMTSVLGVVLRELLSSDYDVMSVDQFSEITVWSDRMYVHFSIDETEEEIYIDKWTVEHCPECDEKAKIVDSAVRLEAIHSQWGMDRWNLKDHQFGTECPYLE